MKNTPEARKLESYVQIFARRWDAATEGSPEREIQRRNCLLGLIFLADQELNMATSPREESVVISGLERVRQHPQWRVVRHTLFASIQPKPGFSSSISPIEVMQSLAEADGTIAYDLTVIVP